MSVPWGKTPKRAASSQGGEVADVFRLYGQPIVNNILCLYPI